MFRFLYRSLFTDRSRTALSMLAVGSAIMLLVVLEGFKVGLWQQVRSYREHLPVQLVATASSTSSTVQTRSSLPPDIASQVEAVPGVQRAYPLVSVPAIFAHRDMKTPISVIGYDTKGGPWLLKSGRNNAVSGEMVMDYALAKKHRLDLGDTASLFGRDFRVVGLSGGTASMLGSYVFIGLEDAYSIVSTAESGRSVSANAPNLLLVEAAPGFQVATVRKAVEEAVLAIDLLSPGELADNDVASVQESIGPAINLMIFVAYLVGVLVIGLTLYATVFERLRETGIMKAIGASDGRLYRYVLGQAMLFAVAGFALGLAGSLGVAALISWFVPQYLVVPLDSQVLLRSGVAGLLMSSLASLLPIRQVAGVDPAVVFRQ
ncbi:MAG: ABC transporter permease [Chloroflexi bacterium]|nr:ABC transporter permease [Chloroflexota bacterium]